MDISVIGRGGQGAVSAVYMLASSAFNEGYFAQASAMFGIERQGSPVNAYCRISKKEIMRYDEITTPDILILLDPTLLVLNPEKSLKKGGLLIINTSKKPEDFKLRSDLTVKTVNAGSIALKIFKRPLFNTPMISAFASITGLISMNSLSKAIHNTFETKGSEVINLNIEAAKLVYKTYANERVMIEL